MAPKRAAAAPKKVPKARAKPAAKAALKKPEEVLKDEKGEERLASVLEEIFQCYDHDKDGQIERIEFLETEEKRWFATGFGPKARRERFQWFKDAGAEGNPTDGMYLSKEKWQAAFVTEQTAKSEIPEKETLQLADWIWENIGAELAKLYAPKATGAGGGGAAPSGPPEYPLQCPLKDLAKHMLEARAWGKMVLVLACGLEQVETYMSYQLVSAVEAKKILVETATKKCTKEEAQADVRSKLKSALNCTADNVMPLWLCMRNSAFDWNAFCDEEASLPSDVFSATLWSPENAKKHGLIDDMKKMVYELEDEAKWKEFYVVITSTFDLESANEHLPDKIPHWDELAIITIDPESCK